MIKDFVAVTDDRELNNVLVDIFETNEDPQTAVWTMVDAVGIEAPFDRSQFPQPFSVSEEDDGPVVQWPVPEETSLLPPQQAMSTPTATGPLPGDVRR